MAEILTANFPDDLQIRMEVGGAGPAALVLHGGGGPATVAGISAHLAATMRTITPIHPGWNGNARPEWLTGIDDIAATYLACLRRENLRDVLVIGSSIGGWLAAEMAWRDGGERIGGLVLINAMGIDVPGETPVDFFSLTPRGVAEHSFADPDRFFVDPASFPLEGIAVQRANMATLKLLGGDMRDPKLRRRLHEIDVPTLVLWGEADRIAPLSYGRAFAEGIPNARLQVVERAGHLPQIEQPAATFAAIDAFRSSLG